MLRLITFGRVALEGRPSSDDGDIRPRQLAILAVLAAAGSKGVSRERLQTILWGDKEPERARHSLSQALYSLKRELGVEASKVAAGIRIEPASLSSDIDDFHAARAAGDWTSAARLYAGPFLDGFYLFDAPDFERWAEEERGALRRLALATIETAARRASAEEHSDRAISLWRQLTALDPLNGKSAVAYAEALLATGDRAAALRHVQSQADSVRRELEQEPETEVLRLIDSLRDARDEISRSPAPRTVAVVQDVNAAAAYSPAESKPARSAEAARRRTKGPAMLLAAAIIAVLLAGAWRATLARRPQIESQPSAVATRFYEDGLRAFYQFDYAGAARLLDAALAEDSTFAMAAYYAWRAEAELHGPREAERARRAAVLANGASARDRGLIIEHLAAEQDDPRALPAADSLAERYSNDAEILMRDAALAPELGRAVALLERSIAADSTTASVPGAICRTCASFYSLARRYESADSLALADATIERWIRLRPAEYQPWLSRAELSIATGRRRAAELALERADSLGASRADSLVEALARNLRLDDVDSTNALCAQMLPTADSVAFVRLRTLCVVGLRMQGRFLEALALTHDGRIPGTGIARQTMPVDSIQAATLDLEMWRPRIAAKAYASIAAATPSGESNGIVAHDVARAMTLAAAAAVISGDTVRARSLADSIELIGHRSLDARDPPMHQFVRGLLLAGAGHHEEAVREFRGAMVFPVNGFTRINYAMAQSLMAVARPQEAVIVLRAALASDLDDARASVTRTDLHALLADAFAASNLRDSAAVHYATVAREWRLADPSVARRYERANQFLLRTGRVSR